ncbi:A.superbus venom factor 1-like [Hyla sarda]|uniref:A.superbus venom factor 1-like n=1 Tax=Hyla sarda TaxID=327740 RepID=UPI0024C31C79|nr:A.superbus venom factor 1-like [Hyla sarda]
MYNYLSKESPITPVFYTVPKIHKDPLNPPGRPIVASVDSVLSPLSILLERTLTPLTKNTRAFLLDTTAFLQELSEICDVTNETWLISIDVCSLYTSIVHTKGLEATEWLLNTRLKFTLVCDQTQVSFLDTMVQKDGKGGLKTDLFRKETDQNKTIKKGGHRTSIEKISIFSLIFILTHCGLYDLYMYVNNVLVSMTTCFALIAPNIIHTGNEENIVIQCHECAPDMNLPVKIMVNNFPKDDKNLYQTATTLTASNNYLTTANIKIPYNYLTSDRNEKQYVIVRASSLQLFEIEKVILVSPHTGYIFIQTDKTIYTPNQNVNYRIFTTDQNLDPADQQVTVSLQNPNSVIVHREDKMPSKGLTTMTMKIPELVNIGTWKIIAKFSHSQQKEYTMQFEVQEYVLPTFKVELETEKKFFYYKDEELVVNIKATYLFDKNVNGYAVAIFVLFKDSLKTLHGSMKRVQITEGKGSIALKRAQLLEAVNNENELIGYYIYSNVTVFSTDGDYVTAHKTNIKIVSSPYNIALIRTPSYFIPGAPFKLTVSVKNPDMTPAANVPVVCGKDEGRSSQEGLVELKMNTQASQKELTLTLKTADRNLQDEQQATVTMTAKAYQPTWKQNFLHIDCELVNDNVNINLNIQTEDNLKENIKYFTILVTSRGKILQTIFQKRGKGELLSAVRLTVTPDMLPSFRIVAYYYLFIEERFLELVSDSVWLNMRRTCKGTLKINPPRRRVNVYKPHEMVELGLVGDKGATVGLVAVDKGVFVLNNKSRLTQDKIWDDVQQNDIGCTPGSGANPLGVFQDAGLDFTTNLNIQTSPRRDFTCTSSQHGRSRRSIEILEAKQKKASSAPEHLRLCCLAGLHESPIGLSCSKRRKQVQQGEECANMFFECCFHVEELKKRFNADFGIDRSFDGDTEEDLEDDITPRSNFPESWRWNVLHLEEESKKDTVDVALPLRLPDSITTWVVQAISIRKDKGICVSEPYEVTTFKEFFVDLRMPYSVIRNEQVQIRAVVHNYMTQQAKVNVKFFYNENVCSLATKSRGYQETVRVPAESSKVVYFVVVPLKATEVYIDVLAMSDGFSDRVRKILHVLPEGKLVRKQSLSQSLDPKGSPQRIQIKTEDLEGMVPDSDATSFISIQGDIMGETLLGILDHNYLGSLIYVPYGCPEQNMFSTTLNVILTKYLDATKRWDAVGAEKRRTAVNNIIKGYQKQIYYFSGDSFQGSTWLTAYVVKIFSLAFKADLLDVNKDILCNSSMWLVKNQKDNGEFQELGIVYTKTMQGGYAESESSLTAFVLIALAELGNTCGYLEIKEAMKKAEKYLAAELPKLKHTYSAAITSYALSLVGNTQNEDIIDLFASKDRTYWPVGKSLFTVEATGYALLQKLKLRKFEEAHKIAEWLVKVRAFGGGYSSTQATIIALQALSQYQIDTSAPQTVSLDVTLVVEGRQRPLEFSIRNADMYLERTTKVPANKNLTIEVTGTGKGTVTVMTVYQALLNAEKQCNGFTLEAEVKPHETKADTYTLHLRTRYQGELPATMTLIEVTMLSGFSPIVEDLKKLENKVENYIMKFETQSSTSNGTVVLYLTKVPNNEDFEIGFGIHKNFEIGLLQPADISIYEYYDLDKKCSTFYNLPEESGHLRKICKGSSCKCATEKCASLRKMTDKDTLQEMACAVGVDFVVKVQLTHSSREANYDFYNFTILDVIKEGANIVHSSTGQRQFLNHMACSQSLELQTNMNYLIMNHYSNVWETLSLESYMFSSKTFILHWPEGSETLKEFTDTMKENGCDT